MRWCTWLMMAVGLLSPRWVSAETLEEALTVLRAVGREAEGSTAAQASWRVVAGAEAARLPVLLAALDGASPLAANYLRSAIEALSEREARAGRPLAPAMLEAYVRDTQHGPRSRRLAFELLAVGDAAAAERMVPGFVNDPSLELRRDAIARLITDGQALVKRAESEPNAKVAAGEVLSRALASARDLDQIEQLAKDLKELDVKVDLPRHFGFLTQWRLIGPFDNREGIGFKTVYPPERDIDPTVAHTGKAQDTLRWIEHTTTDDHGMVDFNKALGKDMGAVGYAVTEFYSDRPQTVELRVGCICACKLWLNGQLLMAHEVYHSGTKVDQYRAVGQLEAGKNVILVKVLQNEQTESWAQDWQFQLRVCDSIGTAIHSSR